MQNWQDYAKMAAVSALVFIAMNFAVKALKKDETTV